MTQTKNKPIATRRSIMSTLQQNIDNQIKLRFWDTKENRWCGRDISGWVLIDENNNDQQGIIIAPKYEHIVTMRFTGLLDKRGKEIYEGDILKGDWAKVDGIEVGAVVFYGGAFRFKPAGLPLEYAYYLQECEIIGNIYQDKKLLKEQ